MASQSHRLFVGNLPPNITSKDITKGFSEYGQIENIEIKKKTDAEGNFFSAFAFVTLMTTEQRISNCVHDLHHSRPFGDPITVQQAKESFMQRIKREREQKQENPTENDGKEVKPKEKKKTKTFENRNTEEDKLWQNDEDAETDDIPVNRKTKLPPFRGISSVSGSDDSSSNMKSSESLQTDANVPLDVDVDEPTEKFSLLNLLGARPNTIKDVALPVPVLPPTSVDENMQHEQEEEMEGSGKSEVQEPVIPKNNIIRRDDPRLQEWKLFFTWTPKESFEELRQDLKVIFRDRLKKEAKKRKGVVKLGPKSQKMRKTK